MSLAILDEFMKSKCPGYSQINHGWHFNIFFYDSLFPDMLKENFKIKLLVALVLI